jgi:hypothetical protein
MTGRAARNLVKTTVHRLEPVVWGARVRERVLATDPLAVMVAACATLVLGVTYARHFYGLDFTDESYYLAVPYRFVLGARPFVDETWPPQQTAALLAYPLIAAYHVAIGVDGLFLFVRQLHFVFTCGVASCVFLGLRPFLGTMKSVLPSLLPVAFIPFNLPDLSYNTMGSGFFVAGCFLGVRFLFTRQRSFLAAAGLMHGLAIFVYLPLIVPSFVCGLLLALRSEERRLRILGQYVLAATIPLAVLGGLIANAGLGNVRDMISNALSFGGEGGGIDKAASLPGALVQTVLGAPLGVVAVVTVLALSHLRPRLVRWLLPLIPLLLVPAQELGKVQASLDYVTIYGMAALPLFLLLRDDAAQQSVFLAVWPAAFVGGLVTAWSSNNGVINFGLGFAPAPIVTTVLLTEGFARARRASAGRGPVPQVGTFAASGALAVLLGLQFTSVYRDGDFRSLRSRVRTGPFAGIYTTSEKRHFIAAISTDLRTLAPPTCRILFYDSFPAGYLLTSSRGYTNSVWLFRAPTSKEATYRRVLLRYYAKSRSLPDIVVRMSNLPGLGSSGKIQYTNDDPLDHVVRQSGKYKLVAKRADYGVYVRRAARCVSLNANRRS